jgi:hypothetical protein
MPAMNKILFASLLLAAVFAPSNALAQSGDLGVGVVLGEPTGVNFKYWISQSSAVDGGAAWSIGKHDSLELYADYLSHRFDLFKAKTGKLPLHFGLGGRLVLEDEDDDSRLGVRIPIGLSYLLVDEPLEFFLEIAPILDLVPETKFDLNGGIGVRYYF